MPWRKMMRPRKRAPLLSPSSIPLMNTAKLNAARWLSGKVESDKLSAPSQGLRPQTKTNLKSAYTAIGKDEPNTKLNSVIAPSQEPALRSQRGTTSTGSCQAIAHSPWILTARLQLGISDLWVPLLREIVTAPDSDIFLDRCSKRVFVPRFPRVSGFFSVYPTFRTVNWLVEVFLEFELGREVIFYTRNTDQGRPIPNSQFPIPN